MENYVTYHVGELVFWISMVLPIVLACKKQGIVSKLCFTL